jgi:hypothetical protein
MSDREQFEALLEPVLASLADLDPADDGAAAALEATFPVDGDAMKELAALFARGVADGWLCDREGGPGVRFSRVRKAAGDGTLSIDAVRMDRPGPGHTHPNGEFDLCFAVDGDPRFDDRPAGWTVYPPGSWHVPTVAGGTMNILYFLPGGAIQFGPKPE